MLMPVLALFLSFPSFTGSGDSYNDELRLLDLEVEMLFAQIIGALARTRGG
jgi:hypothetical protein